MTRAFLPLLLRGGRKTIVNVGSVGATMLSPGGSGYQSAKFALLKLTEHTAFEYGGQGVVAVTVHPGGLPRTSRCGFPTRCTATWSTRPSWRPTLLPG